MNGGFSRRITYKWSIFQQAMFDETAGYIPKFDQIHHNMAILVTQKKHPTISAGAVSVQQEVEERLVTMREKMEAIRSLSGRTQLGLSVGKSMWHHVTITYFLSGSFT